MRFLLDESADLPLADYLRARGHYVLAHYADHLDQFLVVSQRQVRVRSVQRR